MFDGVRPIFAMHEVARCFFGMSVKWLRKHLAPLPGPDGTVEHHWISEEFGEVEWLERPSGAKIFRLHDIEKLAHAFFEHGMLQPEHLIAVIKIVKSHIEICRSKKMKGFV